MRLKNKKIIITGIALLVLLPGSLVFVPKLVPVPPTAIVKQAREAVTIAHKNHASVLSSKKYREAKLHYDSAMFYWQKENRRWIFLRDYSNVEKSAKKALSAAGVASNHAQDIHKTMTETLPGEIETLTAEIQSFKDVFRRLPLSREQFDSFSKGSLLLEEASQALKQGELTKATDAFNRSEALIRSPLDQATGLIDDYFENYDAWKSLVDRSIKESKRARSVLLVVDKFARECSVYTSGSLKSRFSIELGKNWIGDKARQGDKATPEGSYSITEKLKGSKTKYYKALLLNYPNEEDRKRFDAAVKAGTIPNGTHIGGEIEIHGDGGKGTDWTDGCVALENSEMDKLFNSVSVGTKVIIVGSTKSLEEVKNQWK
jgi:hypothetical protein